jgi:hypothetical protein
MVYDTAARELRSQNAVTNFPRQKVAEKWGETKI